MQEKKQASEDTAIRLGSRLIYEADKLGHESEDLDDLKSWLDKKKAGE